MYRSYNASKNCSGYTFVTLARPPSRNIWHAIESDLIPYFESGTGGDGKDFFISYYLIRKRTVATFLMIHKVGFFCTRSD